MTSRKLTGSLVHVPLNSGGYDRRGEYYGTGARLFRYRPDEDCDPPRHEYIHHGIDRGRYMQTKENPCTCANEYFEFRAADRQDAIRKLHGKCSKARVRGTRSEGLGKVRKKRSRK